MLSATTHLLKTVQIHKRERAMIAELKRAHWSMYQIIESGRVRDKDTCPGDAVVQPQREKCHTVSCCGAHLSYVTTMKGNQLNINKPHLYTKSVEGLQK